MKVKSVYLDHAATTPVHPQVLEAMLPYFSQRYGNPSGLYALGREAHKALEKARRDVAGVLGCEVDEVIFSSGGTESNSAALKGAALSLRGEGNHIITSAIEHDAVLGNCRFLEELGFEVSYLPVDGCGLVSPEVLGREITGRTVLVSIMLANNEVGTIEPIAELSRVVKERGGHIVFHTDAVQGAGALDLEVNRLGIDMLSLSAHKFYGPKGVGVLYMRRGIPFVSQQSGGHQEGNRRAGTENVAGVVGMATTLQLASEHRGGNSQRCQRLRDRLVEGLISGIPGVHLNGHPELRLPNNASLRFDYIDGEAVLLALDQAGVAASTGSACASGSEEPSHVLLALGIPPQSARSSVRFTFGPDNTDEDVDYLLSIMPGIVDRLRAMSPLAGAAGQSGEGDV